MCLCGYRQLTITCVLYTTFLVPTCWRYVLSLGDWSRVDQSLGWLISQRTVCSHRDTGPDSQQKYWMRCNLQGWECSEIRRGQITVLVKLSCLLSTWHLEYGCMNESSMHVLTLPEYVLNLIEVSLVSRMFEPNLLPFYITELRCHKSAINTCIRQNAWCTG